MLPLLRCTRPLATVVPAWRNEKSIAYLVRKQVGLGVRELANPGVVMTAIGREHDDRYRTLLQSRFELL